MSYYARYKDSVHCTCT